jgi:hypothetical protein
LLRLVVCLGEVEATADENGGGDVCEANLSTALVAIGLGTELLLGCEVETECER